MSIELPTSVPHKATQEWRTEIRNCISEIGEVLGEMDTAIEAAVPFEIATISRLVQLNYRLTSLL